MRYEMLVSVVAELSELLPGMRVRRVFEGAEGIHLLLHRPGRDLVLLIAPDRSLPRMHLVAKKPAAVTPPHAMVLYLRNRLTGATIGKVAIVNNDRVVEIVLSRQGTDHRLVAELTGSAANLILTDAACVIQMVYFPAPEVNDRKRPLLAGLTYAPPFMREPGAAVPARRNHAGDTGANAEAEAFFAEQVSHGQVGLLRRELSGLLAKALARVRRRSEALSRELAATTRADEFRRTGDLILANLAGLERGQEQAELADYEGALIMVRLDPRCSPIGNAEQYFKKYKRAKSGRAIVLVRLDQARVEAESLESLQAAVAAAPDVEALVRLHDEMNRRGYRKAAPAAAGQGRKNDPSSYRRTVFLGWEIFVGRSAAGNDYLTTRLARPDDRWLHAEGMPGSHVLVRNPRGGPVPAEVLMKAASYAAFYSKGRGAGKVPVTHTLAGKVHKPKRAKPGMVVLSERESVMAVPEELREESSS